MGTEDDDLSGGPPVVAEAVARESRQKREEYVTVQDALDARVAEYEAAVGELDQVLREQRPRLEQRIDRLRQQRWDVVDAFLEEKRALEWELVRLRGAIVELEAVFE